MLKCMGITLEREGSKAMLHVEWSNDGDGLEKCWIGSGVILEREARKAMLENGLMLC